MSFCLLILLSFFGHFWSFGRALVSVWSFFDHYLVFFGHFLVVFSFFVGCFSIFRHVLKVLVVLGTFLVFWSVFFGRFLVVFRFLFHNMFKVLIAYNEKLPNNDENDHIMTKKTKS